MITFFNSHLFLFILFVFLFVITYFIHSYFYLRSHKFLIRKANTNADRWASQTKPILGGVTFLTSILIGTSIMYMLNIQPLMSQDMQTGLLLSIIFAFMMGLADDLLNTPPRFKFFVQLIVATIFISSGVKINIFSDYWINISLTYIWVIGIMNSINMLDNMDAVNISVLSPILLFLMVFATIFNSEINWLIIFLLPAMLSFFIFNWHPSKMYMGDNGSQLLGIAVAGIAILYFWNHRHTPVYFSQDVSFLLIYLAFLVPITDTTTVTTNRLLRGQSPFKGGRDHTTHFLVYRGFTERQTAFILMGISSITNLFASLILFGILTPTLPLKIGLWTFGLTISLLLYLNTKLTKIPQAKTYE
jgi:UDP-GlcNAc:undecaprenyl-phosphate GlcNAc-1-phosphate transferase